MFSLNRFPLCCNLFLLLFLVIPCLVLTAQPCIEWIPIKKKSSSHRRCSVKKDVLKNFVNFTGKHQWKHQWKHQSLFLIKLKAFCILLLRIFIFLKLLHRTKSKTKSSINQLFTTNFQALIVYGKRKWNCLLYQFRIVFDKN